MFLCLKNEFDCYGDLGKRGMPRDKSGKKNYKLIALYF